MPFTYSIKCPNEIPTSKFVYGESVSCNFSVVVHNGYGLIGLIFLFLIKNLRLIIVSIEPKFDEVISAPYLFDEMPEPEI